MFPATCLPDSHLRRFPRARGDVPQRLLGGGSPKRFSPRTRGCSLLRAYRIRIFAVFPAHAGMFRSGYWGVEALKGFPRARGDVPVRILRLRFWKTFSPRARGCSAVMEVARKIAPVFPACAGMFLAGPRGPRRPLCFPRVRGDVPINAVRFL